jgi:AbrB family looped-hinge helix DNA binding protein
MQLITMTTKGQVTIPINLREKLRLIPGDRVIFEEDNNVLRVSSVPDFFSFRGSLKGRGHYNIVDVHKKVAGGLAKRYIKTLKK